MIPFIDLQEQQNRIRPYLEARMAKVLKHGQYIMGPEVNELEEKLAAYVGVKHCISVANGTDALMIALMTLDIGQGDEVITTPFTFIAAAEVIAFLGAKPVFVDIDERTYNIDPKLIEGAITNKTKAIIPVDLYGQCAEYDDINAIAARYAVPVIEDAAQSFGAVYKGRRACGLSRIGCTSFFPTKPLGCYGDGGACFTDDDDIAERMRQIRHHGQLKRYYHTQVGVNSRLDSLQAAILLAKLEVFDLEVQWRTDIGTRYTDLLQSTGVGTPYIAPHNSSIFAQYSIQVSDRSALQEKLKGRGIPSMIHYPITLNRQPVFQHLAQVDFPIAEHLAEHVLSIPMHPYLDKDVQKQIVDVLEEFHSRIKS